MSGASDAGRFGEASNAYDDKVGNPSFTLNFQGLPFLDLLRIYKKK
ncbi:MAG TPA: hypothetical protein VKQ71_00830 [Acidimicrobiales bacterium]|nr:hypothetical protein [Acidimicrobiales bacterium]